MTRYTWPQWPRRWNPTLCAGESSPLTDANVRQIGDDVGQACTRPDVALNARRHGARGSDSPSRGVLGPQRQSSRRTSHYHDPGPASRCDPYLGTAASRHLDALFMATKLAVLLQPCRRLQNGSRLRVVRRKVVNGPGGLAAMLKTGRSWRSTAKCRTQISRASLLVWRFDASPVWINFKSTVLHLQSLPAIKDEHCPSNPMS